MPLEHEELHVRRGERTGVQVVVAIHSTVLGPALGGARLWRYEAPGDGIADALRLSQAMTMKAAAAGLNLGGGKCVICTDDLGPAPDLRRLMMLDVGDAVDSLSGRYVTAEDVGTTPQDMVSIAERTEHVVGLPPERGGCGDPSPLTARGVEAAIRASLTYRFGNPEIAGRRICVIGLGHVGLDLAARLAAAGAELVVSDLIEAKREHTQSLSATWVGWSEAAEQRCDVLAPCALSGAVNAGNVDRLRAEIVCGSANNMLADPSLAEALASRGVLYAPDFIANAGGLLAVAAELRGTDARLVGPAVDGIEAVLAAVLERADADGVTPLAAAFAIASERLSAGRFGVAVAD
jgi:leucine dehydrogenase